MDHFVKVQSFSQMLSFAYIHWRNQRVVLLQTACYIFFMTSKDNLSFFSTLSRLTRMYSKALAKRLEPHGVKPGYLNILFVLWESENLTQSELKAQLTIEQATLSNTLKRMQRDGITSLTRSPEDKRRLHIRLTDKGRQLNKIVLIAIEDIQSQINQGLTINDRKYFHRILNQMSRHLEADLEERCFVLIDAIDT